MTDPEDLPGDRPVEISLLGSSGDVLATQQGYPQQSVTFSAMPPMTITGMVYHLPGGERVTVSLDEYGKHTQHVEHVCDTPDENLFDGVHWMCPDCARVWEVCTESWWQPVD